LSAEWNAFWDRISSSLPGTHSVKPPAPASRLQDIQRELGEFPEELLEMLAYCNGAELFISAIPLVTLFGISPLVPVPTLQWASDWYVDRFTPAWRGHSGCAADWAIAMTSYGALVVLRDGDGLREWDCNERRWLGPQRPIGDWLSAILHDGGLSGVV
jgi:hypothetical protein